MIETRDFGYKTVDWIHSTKSTVFVKSYDEKENKVVWNMVEASKKSIVNKLVYIKTVSGKFITCTIEHKIWSEGKYIIAGLLMPAMKVFVSDGFGIREDVISGVKVLWRLMLCQLPKKRPVKMSRFQRSHLKKYQHTYMHYCSNLLQHLSNTQ